MITLWRRHHSLSQSLPCSRGWHWFKASSGGLQVTGEKEDGALPPLARTISPVFTESLQMLEISCVSLESQSHVDAYHRLVDP
jgi:hypothetical protein